MALSNTAVPKYYGAFREAVIRGQIPVNKEISMEMNRIDDLIANPGVYYDDEAINGFVDFCENELTLTDGSDLKLMDTFKLWAEQLFGWYYFVELSIPEPDPSGRGTRIVNKKIKKRLTNKQYLIIARGAAKSMYDYAIQAYFLTVDTSTTHQITTAPTMKLSEEVMSPFITAITRARGPLFKFLTYGSLQNTTGPKAQRQKLVSTKKGIQNFLTNSLLEVRPMAINKLQGLRCKVATVDEWLSGDLREDPIGAIEQGASKVDDYVIVATSSEGTVRNGSGDDIKIELMDILKGEYINPHVSIWWYKLDSLEEIEEGKNKFYPTEEEKNPNMRFVENPMFRLLHECGQLQDGIKKLKINWIEEKTLLRSIFDHFKGSESYKTYMSKDYVSFEDHRKIIVQLFKNYIIKNDNFFDELAEKSFSWLDDFDYICQVVIVLLRNWEDVNCTNKVLPLPFDKTIDNEVESDREFTKNLFRNTILHWEEYEPIMERRALNWDRDRMAFIDVVIIKMAMSEFIYAPTVPIRVSLNEYIELAKELDVNPDDLWPHKLGTRIYLLIESILRN